MAVIIDTPALDVFEHMAADEIMCQDRPDPFILRFFRWARPPSTSGEGRRLPDNSRDGRLPRAPVTFGYSQRYRDVIAAAGGDSQLVRRPTGGGLVLHDSDITFSCIFEMPGALSPAEIYSRIHGAVHSGLKGMGIHSTLMSSASGDRALSRVADRKDRHAMCRASAASEGSKEAAEGLEEVPVPNKSAAAGLSASQGKTGLDMKCFARPVRMDIVAPALEGQGLGGKILGGALRRFGDHVLYQGSLRINGAKNSEKDFHSAISGALALEWSLKWDRRRLEDEAVNRIRALAGVKYRSEEWNERI